MEKTTALSLSLVVVSLFFIASLFMLYSKDIEIAKITQANQGLAREGEQLTGRIAALSQDLARLKQNLNNAGGQLDRLKRDYALLANSINTESCPTTGARQGALSCTSRGWLLCYESFEDENPADKNAECCQSVQGSWQEGRCCAPDKLNSAWQGRTGRCSETGAWVHISDSLK